MEDKEPKDAWEQVMLAFIYESRHGVTASARYERDCIAMCKDEGLEHLLADPRSGPKDPDPC